GVICFGFGFLFGQPALRLSGVYLALATFALATAMPQLLKLGYFEKWTGGVQGLVVTKPDAPFGLPISQDMWIYYFTLVITLAISLFLGMVVGGVGWLPGSIVGSAFIIFVPNIAEGISKGLSGAVFGVLLFLVIFLVPHGARQVAIVGQQLIGRFRKN